MVKGNKKDDAPSKEELARRRAQSERDKAARSNHVRDAPTKPRKQRREKAQRQPRPPKAPGFYEEDYNRGGMGRQTSSKRLEMTLPGRETTNFTCKSKVNSVVDRLPVNPGDAVLFPVGSITAKAWQRFDPRRSRVKFLYTPIAGAFAAANASGDVFMAWTSDPTDPRPSTQGEVMKFQPSVMGLSSLPLELTLTGREFNMEAEFLRRGGYYEGRPAAEFDVGALFIGFQGNGVDDAVIGVLSVEYEFHFLDQHVASTRAPVPIRSMFGEQSISVPNGVAQTMTPATVLTAYGSGITVSGTAITLQGPGIYRLRTTAEPAALGAGAFTGITLATTFTAVAGVVVYGMGANTNTWAAAAGVTDTTISLDQMIILQEGYTCAGACSVNQSNSGGANVAIGMTVYVESVPFA